MHVHADAFRDPSPPSEITIMLQILTADHRMTGVAHVAGEPARRAQPLLSSVLQQLDRPVLVLKGSGDLVYANACGIEFLDGNHSLRLAEGRVVATDPAGQKAWRVGLERCRAGSRHLIFLGDGTSGRAICACPVDVADGGERLVLAVVGGGPTAPGYPLKEFGRHFGLTTGEVMVLEQLLANRKPADIARETHRSVATVRAHVRNLLAKTDCCSMSDLLLRVSRLPPVRGDMPRAGAGLDRSSRRIDRSNGAITSRPAAAWQ